MPRESYLIRFCPSICPYGFYAPLYYRPLCGSSSVRCEGLCAHIITEMIRSLDIHAEYLGQQQQ